MNGKMWRYEEEQGDVIKQDELSRLKKLGRRSKKRANRVRSLSEKEREAIAGKGVK